VTNLLIGSLTYIFEIIVLHFFIVLIFSGELLNANPQEQSFIILRNTILIRTIMLNFSNSGMLGASEMHLWRSWD
jgi:hypothetical protein